MLCHDNIVVTASDNPRITKLAERSPKVCRANEQEGTKLCQSLRCITRCERTAVARITSDQKQLADRFQKKLARSQLLDSRLGSSSGFAERRGSLSTEGIGIEEVAYTNRVTSAGRASVLRPRTASRRHSDARSEMLSPKQERPLRCKTAGARVGASKRHSAVTRGLTEETGCFSEFGDRRRGHSGRPRTAFERLGSESLRSDTTVTSVIDDEETQNMLSDGVENTQALAGEEETRKSYVNCEQSIVQSSGPTPVTKAGSTPATAGVNIVYRTTACNVDAANIRTTPVIGAANVDAANIIKTIDASRTQTTTVTDDSNNPTVTTVADSDMTAPSHGAVHPVSLTVTADEKAGVCTQETQHASRVDHEDPTQTVTGGVPHPHPDEDVFNEEVCPTKKTVHNIDIAANYTVYTQATNADSMYVRPMSILSNVSAPHRPTTAMHSKVSHVVLFLPPTDATTSGTFSSTTGSERSGRDTNACAGRTSFLRTVVDSYAPRRPVRSAQSRSRSCSAVSWQQRLLPDGVTSGQRNTSAGETATPASLRLRQLRVRTASYESKVSDFCKRILPLRSSRGTGADYYYHRLKENTPVFNRPIVRLIKSPDTDYMREIHIQGIRNLTFRVVNLIL